jgi:methylenetetrahydrofolate dehydrogenase (NADP+)/methenyltetrahydrofolate cyclohydrolase
VDVNDAKLIDGRKLAQRLREAAAEKVAAIREATGVIPSLATVLVGDDPGSVMYTRMKRRRCKEVGIVPRRVELPVGTTTEQLIANIRDLAASSCSTRCRARSTSGPPSRRSPSRRTWTACRRQRWGG